MPAQTWYRTSGKYNGVMQRCLLTCPPKGKACHKHKWTFHLEIPGAGPDGDRLQGGPTTFGFPPRTTWASAAEAAAARRSIQQKHQAGQLPADNKITVGQWLDRWLQQGIDRDRWSVSTARNNADNIKLHLRPQLGDKRLAHLRGLMLTEAYTAIQRKRNAEIAEAEATNRRYAAEAAAENEARRARGLTRMAKPKRVPVPRPVGPVQIERIHATISGACKSAVKAGLIDSNPARDAELTRVGGVNKAVPPEHEEFELLLKEVVGERLFPMVVFYGDSGLRRGEIAGLQRGDIDRKTGKVTVKRQRISVGYTVHVVPAKTRAGQFRTFYLDAAALADLNAWFDFQDKEAEQWGEDYRNDEGWVFTWENGTELHPEYIGKFVSRMMRRAGIKNGPGAGHRLRHYRIACLIQAGADIAAVSLAAGHASTGLTVKMYGHLFDAKQKEMADLAAGIAPRVARKTATARDHLRVAA